MEVQSFNETDYNTGLCDWYKDVPSSTETWCCPYIAVSQQYNMLNDDKPQPNWVLCGVLLAMDAFVTGGFGLIATSVANRSVARRRFGLTSRGPVCDFLTASCCRPCSDCQLYREMSLRNQWPAGFCLIDKPFQIPGMVVTAPSTVVMGVAVQQSEEDSSELHPLCNAPTKSV